MQGFNTYITVNYCFNIQNFMAFLAFVEIARLPHQDSGFLGFYHLVSMLSHIPLRDIRPARARTDHPAVVELVYFDVIVRVELS